MGAKVQGCACADRQRFLRYDCASGRLLRPSPAPQADHRFALVLGQCEEIPEFVALKSDEASFRAGGRCKPDDRARASVDVLLPPGKE